MDEMARPGSTDIDIIEPCNSSHDRRSSDDGSTFLVPPLPLKALKSKTQQSKNAGIIGNSSENVGNSLVDKDATFEKDVLVKKEKIPTTVPLDYEEPSWGGVPPANTYSFEVLKNGVIINNIPVTKSFTVIGRAETCDIMMEHPSVSRYHCIIQYCSMTGMDDSAKEAGLYVYELGSTHRTTLNKHILKSKIYVPLKVGYILKFGGSTRLFVLHGPVEEEEPEMDQTVTELKEAAHQRKLMKEKLLKDSKNGDGNSVNTPSESEGINWGMPEDAVEEDSDEDETPTSNPYAQLEDQLHLDDPKKSLRGWFEREGHGLPNYVVEEITNGFFRTKVELPISKADKVVVVDHRGKKKDAVLQCAQEACRILDKHSLLRQAKHESHARKAKAMQEEGLYVSDDEDEFLDRTGDIEVKRRRAQQEDTGSVLTYESLLSDYDEVCTELERLERNLLEVDRKLKKDAPEELEDFMGLVEAEKIPADKHKRLEWKLQCIKLNKEEVRLRDLVNVARPVGVDEFLPRKSILIEAKNSSSVGSKLLPSERSKILKRFLPGRPLPKSNTNGVQPSGVHKAFLEEEMEYKPKLSKVDCNDDTDNIQPVPYGPSQPKRNLKARRETSHSHLFENPKIDRKSSSNAVRAETAVTGGNKADQKSEKTSEMVVSEVFASDKKSVGSVNISDSDSSSCLNIAESEGSSSSAAKESNDSKKDYCHSEVDGSEGMKRKVVGPQLPTEDFKIPQNKLTNRHKKRKQFDFEQGDEWVPPANQTGDGMTHLNAKFGY